MLARDHRDAGQRGRDDGAEVHVGQKRNDDIRHVFLNQASRRHQALELCCDSARAVRNTIRQICHFDGRMQFVKKSSSHVLNK